MSNWEWAAYIRGRGPLKEIPGVSGVGLAGPEVIAYVKRLTPEILRELPESVNGIPLKVKEIGTLPLLSNGDRKALWRPAPGGVSVGSNLGTTGTHGCVVRDVRTGEFVGISNNHVALSAQWGEMMDGRSGEVVLQPGPAHYSGPGADLGYTVRGYPVPLNVAGAAKIDAAIYTGEFSDEVLGLGTVAPSVPIEPGMLVAKSGVMTGVTVARIESIGAIVDIEGWGTSRFEDVAITETGFCIPGDSGSICVDNLSRSLGLVFAGNERATVICEALEIERLLEIEFGTGDPRLLNLQVSAVDHPLLGFAEVTIGGLLCYLALRGSG